MATVQQHISPDGRLRFSIVAEDDGEVSLGFDGFPWHTHAGILAELSGLPAAEAVRRYVDDILGDRVVIVAWGVAGEIRDVWVSEDPARDTAYPGPGETIELRYWSGRPWFDA